MFLPVAIFASQRHTKSTQENKSNYFSSEKENKRVYWHVGFIENNALVYLVV
jgi:hypothetical protein